VRVPFLIAMCVVGALAVGTASADFTPTGSSGETNFLDIFNHIYGSGFTGTAFAGLSYTNGTITATRIDDVGVGSPLNLSTGHAGSANDQIWQDGVVSASAEARFAGDRQRFGYDPGANGGYVDLFRVQGQGFGATGGINNFSFGGQFAFARDGNGDGPHYSKNSLNRDGADHMITYEITGLGSKTWLLFWEDTDFSQGGQRGGSDGDYNDLVVEVQVISAPTAALLGTIGFFTLVWLKRRLA
jgi:hypothetical protein